MLEVSGVVRDDGSDARVFRRLADGAVTNANILVRTSRPAVTIVEPLRALVLRLSGDRAFTRVSTFRESAVGTLTRMTSLALIVATLVLSLAAIGLYGSISFVTSQRTREVAIRLALGSPRRAVLRLLARDGVLVVAGGSVLGLALTAIGVPVHVRDDLREMDARPDHGCGRPGRLLADDAGRLLPARAPRGADRSDAGAAKRVVRLACRAEALS